MLNVPEAAQWIQNTRGRIAPDGYAWLEAVYWHYKYAPRTAGKSHGPAKVGETTWRTAHAIAHLTECRPSIANLVTWLKMSARTVKYHLAILREAGLLTYLAKGTRIRGVGGRASEFARTIPRSSTRRPACAPAPRTRSSAPYGASPGTASRC